MYKTLIITDIHLRDNDILPMKHKSGLNLRTRDKLIYLNKTIKYAIKNELDSFIIAGDLFNGTRPSNRLKNSVSRLLAKLVRNKIKLYLIGGNHDTTDGNYYNMMSESNFSKYISFTKNRTIETKTNFRLHLLSWNNRHDLKPEKNTILISHLQMENADYGNERLAKHGTIQKDIKDYYHAYLGHLHKRQKGKHYTYIGALAINNFGERNNPTGCLQLTLSNKVEEKFLNISDRSFEKYSFDAKNQTEIKEQIRELDISENSVLNLEIKLPKEAHINRKEIEEWIYENTNIFYLSPINYKRNTELEEQSIKVGIKDREAYDEFIKERDISDFYKKVGNNILKKVEDENK